MNVNTLKTAKELIEIFDSEFPDLGITIHTINHWVNLKILPVTRRIGKKRLFLEPCAIEIAYKVRQLQNTNLPLNIISDQLRDKKIESCKN